MAEILQDDPREMVNGIIVRDEKGLATGELREGDAMNAVLDLVPRPGCQPQTGTIETRHSKIQRDRHYQRSQYERGYGRIDGLCRTGRYR